MATQVNLTKRVKTEAGLRYCPVVMSCNGRVKPDYVAVNGVEELHREGSYYVEWYEGTTRKRLSVGKDAAQAHAQ
jgi:integrase/recombinase XerD